MGSLQFAKEENMLDRLQCWYVFNVYRRSSILLNLAIMMLVFIFASCLDHVILTYKINLSGLIWHLAFAAEILILANVLLYRYLYKNLIIHQESGNPDCERFFLALDQETGGVYYFSETDFVLKPRLEIILIHFTIPLFREEDEESEEGLVIKRACSVSVNLPKSDQAFSFDIFLEMTGEYDLNLLVSFISKQYYNTAIAHVSYEDYVKQVFLEMSAGWMRQADDEAYEDLRTAGRDEYEPSVYAVLKNFLRIAGENFCPILLPNVLAATVALSSGEERRASAPPPGWEQVIATKDQEE
jgi:hypothetical protein